MTRHREGREKPGKAVLIYDGNCPICSGTIAWIRDHEQKDAFETLSCQSTEMSERFPSMEKAVCMQAMQLVLPEGTVLSGEKALPEIFKRLKRFRLVVPLFKLPGMETISRAFYRWFAGRRYHIAKLLFPAKGKRKK